MSYVDNNLIAGEEVIHKGHIHWFVYVPGSLVTVLGAFLLYTLPVEAEAAVYGTILLIVGIYFLLKAAILKFSAELAVTSKRIIAKTGLIRRHTIELSHQKVESMGIDLSIMGRIFNFGTLTINGTGGIKTPIPSIDAPLQFRRKAMETIEQ